MQCFMCVTYLMIICYAHPPEDRENSLPQRRSLFHDVIESLRIRAQLPEVFSDENHIGQSNKKYGFEHDPLQQPNDIDFVPRRNDRLEMPSQKYRFPKNMDLNDTKDETKEEIVLYINAPEETETTTAKQRKTKRPRPDKNKVKKENDEEIIEEKPITNMLSGQSQFGNRESQTVVKPTVIVNFRGSVSNRESDIRLEKRRNNNTKSDVPQNIFNINQEIKLERSDPSLGGPNGVKRVPGKVKQNVRITADGKTKVDDDLMMCETNSWMKDDSRNGRQLLQILLEV